MSARLIRVRDRRRNNELASAMPKQRHQFDAVWPPARGRGGDGKGPLPQGRSGWPLAPKVQREIGSVRGPFGLTLLRPTMASISEMPEYTAGDGCRRAGTIGEAGGAEKIWADGP